MQTRKKSWSCSGIPSAAVWPPYRKVTLVDTRYVDPKLLSNYVNFQNADVLFLYSTLVLNSSGALRG